ncbi:MAG TPA: alanine/ornithine racemase family PLP-dependent enzyme [Candidatus Hydrogenedentes bacterium]|nr:alanine/ornithine racemase family PLP-dependent enzyme [Candidatus Hydrogenedentota bacterium]
MNRVTVNLNALRHNFEVINRWMDEHGASWTAVTKVLCGYADVLSALAHIGVTSMGDSRLSNLRALKRIFPDYEGWYLRVPGPSVIEDVVRLSSVSLNSEIETIKSLEQAAAREGVKHHVIIMIELGDLREGILPGSLVKFYEAVFNLPHIEVLGIGANLGCLAGIAPNMDQLMQLVLYRELLELKFKHKLPLISAGSSATLPLLLDGRVPKGINHFRIGEALFLGTDLINGGVLPELRDDVMLLRAEIAELKEKGLAMPGDGASIAPFSPDQPGGNEEPPPGQRGYRALIGVGQLDTDIAGLTPLNPAHKIAGASSDITVVNLGDDPGGLKVGDAIEFHMNYPALLRLMNCRYITKAVEPPLEVFEASLSESSAKVSPVLECITDTVPVQGDTPAQ